MSLDERAVRSGEVEGSRGDLDANTILADRVRLNFDTSFTGDLLRTRLQARNLVPFTHWHSRSLETLVPP